MCPVCSMPMVGYELDGIELDRCVDCRGIWLDAGELEYIAEQAGAEPGGLSAALRAARGKRHGARRCPRCGRKLDIIFLGPGQSVEVDRCRHGHGLWLDHGELEKLILSHHSGEEEAMARFLAAIEGKAPEAASEIEK